MVKNRMRTILILFVTLFVQASGHGQNKTYFGLEFSVANDLYTISENGNYLTTVPLINPVGGFVVRQEIGRTLFAEAGLAFKYYWEGFGFKTIPTYSSSSSDPSWLIPLRAGAYLNLHHDKIFVTPVVGYSFGINPSFGYGLGYGSQRSGSLTVQYNYTENPDVSRYFSLLQTGLGLEFLILKKALLSISGNYYFGFNPTTKLDITYTVNSIDEYTGRATSRGEFWCASAGIRYPVSDLWQRF